MIPFGTYNIWMYVINKYNEIYFQQVYFFLRLAYSVGTLRNKYALIYNRIPDIGTYML